VYEHFIVNIAYVNVEDIVFVVVQDCLGLFDLLGCQILCKIGVFLRMFSSILKAARSLLYSLLLLLNRILPVKIDTSNMICYRTDRKCYAKFMCCWCFVIIG
jgi:hypothetical protein